MKNFTFKSLIITASLLFASQISAEENDPTKTEDMEPPDCEPFPVCTHGVQNSADEAETVSQLSLLWEKLTQEMKDTVDSLPLPPGPE